MEIANMAKTIDAAKREAGKKSAKKSTKKNAKKDAKKNNKIRSLCLGNMYVDCADGKIYTHIEGIGAKIAVVEKMFDKRGIKIEGATIRLTPNELDAIEAMAKIG